MGSEDIDDLRINYFRDFLMKNMNFVDKVFLDRFPICNTPVLTPRMYFINYVKVVKI